MYKEGNMKQWVRNRLARKMIELTEPGNNTPYAREVCKSEHGRRP
jgi:hypothetical protein